MSQRTVKVVARHRIAVETGELPILLSRDWSEPLPGVRRAVVVLHGCRRDADRYYDLAMKAQAVVGAPGAESLIIAPQFLTEVDVDHHRLSNQTVRWSGVDWEAGAPARAPTPASSFDALDAILRRLGDRKLFPDLADIVLAGHSGGDQLANRYAVLGRGEDRRGSSYTTSASLPSRALVLTGAKNEWGADRALQNRHHQ